MKTITNKLREVSQPLYESTLALNLLRGLNKDYSNTINNIASSTNSTSPMPGTDSSSRSCSWQTRTRWHLP